MLARRKLSLYSPCIVLASLLGLVEGASALEIGEKAPEFTLQSTTNEKISLSRFRGKKLVLLEFYVADFGAT